MVFLSLFLSDILSSDFFTFTLLSERMSESFDTTFGSCKRIYNTNTIYICSCCSYSHLCDGCLVDYNSNQIMCSAHDNSNEITTTTKNTFAFVMCTVPHGWSWAKEWKRSIAVVRRVRWQHFIWNYHSAANGVNFRKKKMKMSPPTLMHKHKDIVSLVRSCCNFPIDAFLSFISHAMLLFFYV